jgi:eukaryotic-like serine/threonine-protein kinase
MNPGDLLRNRYRIEKALAAGGFGETYMAVDLDYPGQRQVVVKHLKPASNDPGTLQIARRLFESEAQVLAELGETSDRLPALYAYFEEQGEFYLVQEFIAGQTLTAELSGRQLSEAETIEVLQEILAGLAVVHGKNKIHRDLKPDNIMRRAKDGKLVLIDFGAVKEVRQAAGMGTNAALSASIGIGTQGYMPTEQAIGFPRLASDVYAVGAIGIQCLTGKHPHGLFDENILALRWQHLCQVSLGLAAVLEKMVMQQPNERYGDGMLAGVAINQLLLARQPLPPKTPSPAAQTQQSQPPVSAPSAPTQKAYVPPAAQTVKVKTEVSIPSKNSGSNGASRRSFLKWLGFGGTGVLGVMALSQLFKNSSTSETVLVSLPRAATLTKAASAPQLTKIQFTSVKLDSYGKEIDQPTGRAEIFTEDLGNEIFLTMVKIPTGKFMMGISASEEFQCKKLGLEKFCSDELPQHLVTVQEFYLSQSLVTQSQYQKIMGYNPSEHKGKLDLPVDRISWPDAVKFCSKLSRITKRQYMLPSEAQWEYACRAGTTTPFSFGETITSAVVNHSPKGSRESSKTTQVGRFPPNLFGLYDMHGNLWEWCSDEYNGYSSTPTDGTAKGDIKNSKKNRTMRGGAHHLDEMGCRSAVRLNETPLGATSVLGLRVATIL